MATFAYLVGDAASKTCGLIDPAFDTDQILAEAISSGYRVTHIINTHGHSDHTAGNQAIKTATGAKWSTTGSAKWIPNIISII